MHKQVRIFLTIPLNSLMLIATYWIFKNINRYSNPVAFLFSLVLLFLCNDLPLSLQLLLLKSENGAVKIIAVVVRNLRTSGIVS